MYDFTPLPSLLGGLLIGLSATLMLALHGRVAGISGISAGLLRRWSDESRWRAAVLLGLLAGGALAAALRPAAFAVEQARTPAALILAGLLVGFGTALGSGCTSGHGVCGVSRLSPRSLVATATFMGTGIVTATIVSHWFGGAL